MSESEKDRLTALANNSWDVIRKDHEQFRPPIEMNGRRYRWQTNFGQLSSPSYRKPAYINNATEMHFAMARRGVGVIPESPPADLRGKQIEGGFAFYAREELSTEEVSGVRRYLEVNYPAQFDTDIGEDVNPASRGVIQLWVDEALAETGLAARLTELDSQ